MQDRDTLKRHAALVDRMATALGIDLEEAVLSGRMAMDELSEAVLRCTGCADPGQCAARLTVPVETELPPGYCRNRDLMTRLRPGER